MEAKCEFSKLTIPNDHSYVKVAVSYADSVAGKLGFSERERADIRAALSEVVTRIIEHAFEPRERTVFDIACERVPLGLKITVSDAGIPFDPRRDSKRDGGTLLTKNLMDEVSFNNLGRNGKETILVKYLRNQDITEYFQACHLEPYAQASQPTKHAAHPIRFTVRQMKPDEAIEVSRAVYRAYGYSYAVPHVYYPERIVALNTSGHMYSAVAVTEEGDFAGHCALFRWDTADRIAELGLGVVKPEYRSHGIFIALTTHLIERARLEKLMGVFGQAVTNHTYSQQVGHRCGLRDCAIALGLVSETETFKGITEKLTQRESVVAHFMYLNKPEHVRIYPPQRHREMIRLLYNHVGAEPEMVMDLGIPPATGQSVIRTETGGPKGFARIEIERAGEDIVSEVKSRLRDLCLGHFEVIHLRMDLFDPATPLYVDDFERLGFFFSGILPGACRGDALILQYLNNVPLDYDKINIDSELGRELLTYIKTQDPNLGF
jgi:anti-sigma regulatory factor (Ser/Thr protein kinase)